MVHIEGHHPLNKILFGLDRLGYNYTTIIIYKSLVSIYKIFKYYSKQKDDNFFLIIIYLFL